MVKIFRKYYYTLFLPICFIFGLIRQEQIQTYEFSIGKPTMSGIFALYAYIFVGICITIISIVIEFICHSNQTNSLKIFLIILVLIIGLPLICFSLLFA